MEHYDLEPLSQEKEARFISLLNSGAHGCHLAFDGEKVVGFSTWIETIPGHQGTAFYMKELFVSQSARGRGVGKALVLALIDEANSLGCCRIDWQTDKDNAAAQEFYRRIGAPLFEKVTYRVRSEEFDTFLARVSGL
ncbi:MAG: GNAT family N-acetyltransferase [Pseudomonadota bacterium]